MVSLAVQRPGPQLSATPELRDNAWFSELYERTFDGAYRYACMLTHDPDRAEDIVADAYLRAWRHRSSLRADSSATSWILSVTRNCVIDEIRKRKTLVNLDNVGDPEDQSDEKSPAELTDAQRQFIQAAIQQLTPEQQRVVFLRFYQQLPHEQVARELGRTPNAVRAIQFRALSQLRKLLESANVQ
jgi:RNA polymerase sigma-70 factor (ECF subfamily)